MSKDYDSFDQATIVDQHHDVENGIPSVARIPTHANCNIEISHTLVDEKPTPEKIDTKDGGYGWVIVVAACLIQVAGGGISQAWGGERPTFHCVMQDYYEQHNFPKATVQLSFVGTIANICLNSLGPVAQLMLALLHIRVVLFIAVILCVLGLEGASWGSEIWVLYVTQGILYGAGASIMFYVAMSVVPEWFEARRGLALGLASSGSSIGSFIMPLIMTSLNQSLGAPWCYRILGLIMLVSGLIATFMFRERGENKGKKAVAATKERPKLREIFQFDLLKTPTFLLWCLTDIFMEGAYYVPFFYLPSYATYLGLSSTQGSALISGASAMNLVGRLVAGFIADRIGHVNTVILYGLASSITCFIGWTFATQFGSLLAYSLLFGFFGGAFISLTPAVTAVVTGMDRLQSGLSAFLLITVIAMFGPNASGAIEQHVPGTPYFSHKMFAGAGYLAGTATLIVLKWIISKGHLLSRL